MARPTKKGLDYYPLDIDFLQDIKVRKIMRACGIQSIAILISLLSSIYRDEGYYVVWDNDMTFLVADEVGASEGAVLEVVNKATQVGLFNKDIFKKYRILTSRGIQKRYLEVVSRRKAIDLISEYLLVDLENEYNNLVNVNINSINDSKSTQRKEKESKVKKSKYSSSNNTAEDETTATKKTRSEFSIVAELYQQCIGQPNALTADWIKDNLEEYGFEWVKNALLEADKNGKRTKKYVEGILNNWKTNGGMTLSSEGREKHGSNGRYPRKDPEHEKIDYSYLVNSGT
jgi:DnaD/phage-associated family protein|nr:MAG TPA: DnaD like replication protein [Caudoviricetes sp.]